MTVAEKITQHVQELPERFQAEVLDFVEYIETKSPVKDLDAVQWGKESLSQAMRGMESEAALYSPADLKEVFT